MPLCLPAPQVCDVLRPDGEAVVLIKPQFEAGKEQVGWGKARGAFWQTRHAGVGSRRCRPDTSVLMGLACSTPATAAAVPHVSAPALPLPQVSTGGVVRDPAVHRQVRRPWVALARLMLHACWLLEGFPSAASPAFALRLLRMHAAVNKARSPPAYPPHPPICSPNPPPPRSLTRWWQPSRARVSPARCALSLFTQQELDRGASACWPPACCQADG